MNGDELSEIMCRRRLEELNGYLYTFVINVFLNVEPINGFKNVLGLNDGGAATTV